MKLLESEVEIFDEELEENLGDYLPDMDWNQILVPKTIPLEQIFQFFEKKGIQISIEDDYLDWICSFENCNFYKESYGNALLGDGSISPSITLHFCNSPNRFWRGH